MERDKKVKIFFLVILFLISIVIYGGIRIFKSYSYISNTEVVREIIKNMAGFYHDRKNYIQYDNSFMNEDRTVTRYEEFEFIEANRDNIKYINNIGFINNVFKYGIGLYLEEEIDELSIQGLVNFGKDIYNKKNVDDVRKNVSFNDGEYIIDYYDNEVVRLSGAMMAIEDYHYLVMYNNNEDLTEIEKLGISKTLKDTLYEGDILVFNNQILLYVGNNMFMYALGEDYDYVNGFDKYEDGSIKLISYEELNNINNDMYLFNSQELLVFRFLNKTGYWNKLPSSYLELKKYYSDEIKPRIQIEKYGSKSNYSDVYQDEIITIIIKIINNSNSEIVIDSLKDKLNLEDVEYISNNYVDDAYMNGELTFTNIKINKNDYVEISYQIKVKKNDGIISFDETKLGEYKLNKITYRVGKEMDMLRLINGQGDIITNYQKLYGITVDDKIMSDNNSDITINNLYGGRIISGHKLRSKKISEDLLITGDIILYDDDMVMYVNENNESYLVSKENQRLDINVNSFLNSLFSKDKFQIIRPSYLYNEFINKVGEIIVDDDKKIITVKKRCTYQDIIDYLDRSLIGDIIDNQGNIITINEEIKTGSKIVVDNGEYLISLIGDTNGDGLINTGDVLKLHRYVLGKIDVMEDVYMYSSYINSDNLINTGDVLKLHRYVLGKIEGLE